MARSFSQLHHRIWADADWRALDVNAQHLYTLLFSQPQTNMAGVLPLQLRKWSSCVAGWTTDDVSAALDTLRTARFVVVDEDTEEVLVRSQIRNDCAYKTPGMLKSILKSAESVQGPELRAALAVELGRLDPLEGKMAAVGAELIAATRLALMPSGGPPDGGVIHRPDGIGEPIAEPIADGFVGTHRGYLPQSTAEPIADAIPDTSITVTGSVKGVSLESSWGGEAPARGQQAPTGPLAPTAPRCIKHSQLRNDEDVPPCRTCQRLRQGWEAQRDAEIEQARVERDKPKAMCTKHHGQTASGCGPCRSERIAARETA